jgi:hypothetical protein
MGNCGEKYFGAESGEEFMFIDKEEINCQFHILLVFDELLGYFDNTLHQALAIPSNCIPFHLEDRSTPNHFRGLDIINSHIQPQNSTSTNNSSEV